MKLNQIRRWLRYAGLWTLGKLYPQTVPTVLMYHSISAANTFFFTVSPAVLRRQLEYLADQRHEFITLDAIAAHYQAGQALPDQAVCLTFDDGYQDNLTAALPILAEFHCPAAVYVVSDFVKQPTAQTRLPICSLNELRQLAAHPLITIGGHTQSHRKLVRLSAAEAAAEIGNGKAQLEDWLGQSVRHFAYPHGSYTPQTLELVQNAGFRTAVTTTPEHANAHRDPFRIGRVAVDQGLPFWLFRTCCTESVTVYTRLKQLFT